MIDMSEVLFIAGLFNGGSEATKQVVTGDFRFYFFRILQVGNQFP